MLAVAVAFLIAAYCGVIYPYALRRGKMWSDVFVDFVVFFCLPKCRQRYNRVTRGVINFCCRFNLNESDFVNFFGLD